MFYNAFFTSMIVAHLILKARHTVDILVIGNYERFGTDLTML